MAETVRLERQDIKSMTDGQLCAFVTQAGFPAFRAKQIRSFLDRGVSDFNEMQNLPAALRALLCERCVVPTVTLEKRFVSALDGTVKYLFRLSDGEVVESVLMHYKHGWSQCLSTQVGCRMGCSFCATGMEGLVRNLLPSEMIAQVEAAQAAEAEQNVRVSHLVLMGMGEPLDNYDNVLRFLHMLSEEGGVHIGMRHVSLSTCGLVDKIQRLQQENLQLTLSVSLHAPNDALRREMMPVAKRWPLDELLSACRAYTQATSRRISFEYAMLDGVNDSDACARDLAGKLKGMLCHVNLIPANEVRGKDHRRSKAERLKAFSEILEKRGIPVTVRRTLGADISASCGQLKRNELL